LRLIYKSLYLAYTWVKIYSQTKKGAFFKNCTINSCNIKDGDDFINFDLINGLDDFKFKLTWKGSGKHRIEWLQKENPLDAVF